MSDDQVRPLVTFMLLSYNQEKFIRDAVTGALAQDYSPLEVIISDDCSTDQTFDVICELVEAYDGPHTVIARQTERNCGSLLHVADVAKHARGDLLVLAAGDDVSKANRVQVVQHAWKRTGAWGLCSRFDRIDVHGSLLAKGVQADVVKSGGFDKYFIPNGGIVRVVHGCTSAYDSRVFTYLELRPDEYVLSEDGAISVLLNLLGKEIVHLDESLVLYRESPGSLTNNIRKRALTYSEIVRDEGNIERFAGAQANRCRLFLRLNEELDQEKVREIYVPAVEAELRLQQRKQSWYGLSLAARVRILLQESALRKWALPRIFGRKSFYLLKWLARRLH